MKMMWMPLMLVLVTGCVTAHDNANTLVSAPTPSTSEWASVPPEFRAACGKPGSEVVTELLKVVIKHADCDLTGVTIVNQGRGAVVPEPGTGVGNSAGVTVEVDKATQDVTFTAEAEVAQY